MSLTIIKINSQTKVKGQLGRTGHQSLCLTVRTQPFHAGTRYDVAEQEHMCVRPEALLSCRESSDILLLAS
jgi:hypothetical protein